MELKDMAKRSPLALAAVLIFTTGVTGCNSSSPNFSTIRTYLFYHDPLTAVDPDDPAAPIEVDAPGTTVANVTAMAHGRYASMLRTIFDRHTRTVVYRNTATGSWWKVSAVKGDGLVPAQLSNETSATTICGTPVQKPDYQNHGNARLVYRLPGPDVTCNNADDVWKMLRLGMSATDAPVPAYEPVAAVHDVQTGALTGWLAKNGNSLYAYDAGFANPVLVAGFTTNATQVAVAPNGIVFLLIDDELHAYDPNVSPATLSSPLHTVVSSLVGAVTDTTHLYFGDDMSVYRVPLDASAPASVFVTDPDGGVYNLVLTDTRVAYTNWTNGKLRSLPKSGGAVTELGATWSLTAAAGSRVYFNTLVFGTPSTYTAHVINDDGSNYTTYANAVWTAVQRDWAYFGATGTSLAPERMLLREGANAAPFMLKSYDAISHTLVASLGTLPAEMSGFTDFRFMRLPNAGHLLVQAYSYANDSYDVLRLNTETDDSLTRLTDTGGVNESMVGASGCSIGRHAEFDPVFLLMLLAAVLGYSLRRARAAGS
jgi:hypothetical protein